MDKLKLMPGSIIGSILATSFAIPTEISTNATMLESDLYLDSVNPGEIVLGDYSYSLRKFTFFSFQNNEIKISRGIYENDYPEIDVKEIPVAKRVAFKLNKPVKL